MKNLLDLSKIPLFLKPKQVEQFLGISINTLNKGVKEGIYERGIHFYIPRGKAHIYWDTNSLYKWMTQDSIDDEVNSIVNDILQIK